MVQVLSSAVFAVLAVVCATTPSFCVAFSHGSIVHRPAHGFSDGAPHKHAVASRTSAHFVTAGKPARDNLVIDISKHTKPKPQNRKKPTAPPAAHEQGQEQESIEIALTEGQSDQFQVVVDKVGHGIATDGPVLRPEPVVEAVAMQQSTETWVGTAEGWVQDRFGQHEPFELAFVGGFVMVMAVLVMALARQQQRAYEEDRQAALSMEPQDLEHGHTAQAGSGEESVDGGSVDDDQPRNESGVGSPAGSESEVSV